jgi:predicted DNA-binding transcriptional regulator YafY
MSTVERGEGEFERPPDFDIQAYMHQAMPFVQSTYRIEVWLDLPFTKAQHRLTPWRMSVTPEDGGTLIRCGRDDLHPFAAMLLSFGARIVVRNPPELREVFAELARCAAIAAQNPG